MLGWGPALQVGGKRGLLAALVQALAPCHASSTVCVTLQESCTACRNESIVERQQRAIWLFTHCAAKLFGPQKGFLKPQRLSKFTRKEACLVKPNQTNRHLLSVKCFREIRVWRNSEIKVFDSIVPWRGDLEGHFQKEFVKNLNKWFCGLRGEPAFR